MAGIGLSDAVAAFIGTERQKKNDEWTARVRKSQAAQLDDEDARVADVNAARQRGAELLAQRQREAEQGSAGLMAPQPVPQAAAPMAAPSAAPAGLNDAGPGEAAPQAVSAAPTDAGLSTPPPTAMAPKAKQSTANPEHILEAYNATADELAKRGRWDDWAKVWGKGAEIRTTLRNQALDAAEAEYRASGDPTVFAKKAYKYIDDGHSFVKADKTMGADGKPVYQITRKNDETGETETKPMTAEQLLAGVAFARDPQAVRKAEAGYAMEQRKALLKIQQVKDEEAVKQPNREKLQTMKNDSAEARTEYRVDNAPARAGATNADGTPKVQSTYTNSEGYRVALFKDGTEKVLGRSGDWAKRVDKLASDLGKGVGGIGKSPQELRTLAEQTLLNSTIAPASPASGASAPSRAASVVSPEVQQGRDSDRAAILADEYKRTTNPGDRDALTREIDRLDPASRAKARARAGIGTNPNPVPTALPPGAKQIGTSKGKPVYETPDGKRFIQD